MGLRDVFKSRKSDAAEENAVFVSTRGGGAVTAPEAVLRGLAPDGGLYADPGIGSRAFDVQGCLALGPLEQAETRRWAIWCTGPMRDAFRQRS